GRGDGLQRVVLPAVLNQTTALLLSSFVLLAPRRTMDTTPVTVTCCCARMEEAVPQITTSIGMIQCFNLPILESDPGRNTHMTRYAFRIIKTICPEAAILHGKEQVRPWLINHIHKTARVTADGSS